MGIDVWEVIEAASTKPFGFMRFDPGPGMGGHCLPIDPFYLAFKAREYDFPTEFIELAGRVNQAQPHFCVDRAVRALNDVGKPARRARASCSSASPTRPASATCANRPRSRSARCSRASAPRSPTTTRTCPRWRSSGSRASALEEGLAECDLAVIVTAHDEIDPETVVAQAQRVLDLRGVTRGIDADHVVRL